jgi:hypothetical protein
VASQLHRAVTTYLAAAADHSGGNDALAVHLSLAYPDGWSWEEAAALIGCLLFVLLAWFVFALFSSGAYFIFLLPNRCVNLLL